jgi:hypothetical protein
MRAARLPVFSLLELISSASNFYSPGYPLEIFFSTHPKSKSSGPGFGGSNLSLNYTLPKKKVGRQPL